jgi:ribitol 2-dehydrogenase
MLPLVIDLLDAKACATLVPAALEKAGRIDILHANAGLYIGGDLVDARRPTRSTACSTSTSTS